MSFIQFQGGNRTPLPAMGRWAVYTEVGSDGSPALIEVTPDDSPYELGPIGCHGMTRLTMKVKGSNSGTSDVTVKLKWYPYREAPGDEGMVVPGSEIVIPAGATDQSQVVMLNIYYPFVKVVVEVPSGGNFEGNIYVYIQ